MPRKCEEGVEAQLRSVFDIHFIRLHFWTPIARGGRLLHTHTVIGQEVKLLSNQKLHPTDNNTLIF